MEKTSFATDGTANAVPQFCAVCFLKQSAKSRTLL